MTATRRGAWLQAAFTMGQAARCTEHCLEHRATHALLYTTGGLAGRATVVVACTSRVFVLHLRITRLKKRLRSSVHARRAPAVRERTVHAVCHGTSLKCRAQSQGTCASVPSAIGAFWNVRSRPAAVPWQGHVALTKSV